MTETMLKGLLGRLSIGYCAFEVLRDDKGAPSDLRFLEATPAFENMTGMSLSESAGKSMRACIGGAAHCGFNWTQLFDEALASPEKDGFTHHVEIRGLQYKLIGFFSDRNTFAVALQGLTEDLANEQIFRQQKQALEMVFTELEVVFNSVQDAIFMVAYDGNKFTYIRNNQRHQELTDYSAEEMYGKTPRELLGDETGSAVEANYLRCIELGESITFEETLTFRGGTRDWLTSLSPVLTSGNLRYVVGCRTDITEVKNSAGNRKTT